MDTKALYERAVRSAPMNQNDFVAYFNDTLASLSARYGDAYISADGGCANSITAVGDDCGVHRYFENAMLDNILSLGGKDETRKNDFAIKAEYAYRSVWRERTRGRKIKKEEW